MRTKASYFKIGIFVITCTILLIAGIIVLSAGALTKDAILLETYIDESVQGLSVGSPVMQRGVQIGTVKTITFVPNVYADQFPDEDTHQFSRLVMVVMEVERKDIQSIDPKRTIEEVISSCVDNGLRLSLSPQGITGIYYMEADYPGQDWDPPIEVTWKPKELYIPSAPSIIESFSQSIDGIFKTLDSIEFEKIANSFDATLNTVTEIAQKSNISEASSTFISVLGELQETNRHIQELIGKPEPDEYDTNLRETLAHLTKALNRIDHVIAGQQSDIDSAVRNISKSAENLRELTESLKRYPSQIFFSNPPSRTEVPK